MRTYTVAELASMGAMKTITMKFSEILPIAIEACEKILAGENADDLKTQFKTELSALTGVQFPANHEGEDDDLRPEDVELLRQVKKTVDLCVSCLNLRGV